MSDLLDLISFKELEALNAKPDKGIGNALKQGYREDAGLHLESDTDAELLIHIPFNQPVVLSGIVIKSTGNADQAPKVVKLFLNSPVIGFSEVASASGVATIELTEGQLAGEVVPLRPVKYSKINWLTIFVESNQGDEETTIIEKIVILGTGGEKMDVKELKDVSKETHDH